MKVYLDLMKDVLENGTAIEFDTIKSKILIHKM